MINDKIFYSKQAGKEKNTNNQRLKNKRGENIIQFDLFGKIAKPVAMIIITAPIIIIALRLSSSSNTPQKIPNTGTSNVIDTARVGPMTFINA